MLSMDICVHPRLILDVAPLEAALNSERERCWDGFLELRKVAGINLFGEAESGINNGRVQSEEVLGDAAGTWVLGVESTDTDLRSAFKVLLEMDAALGEDGTLELGQGGVELGGQPIFQNETGLDATRGGDGEEFGCTRMDVRGVKATAVEEEHRSGETEISEYREVRSVGEIDLTALTGFGARIGGRVEVKDLVGWVLGRKEIETVNFGVGGK